MCQLQFVPRALNLRLFAFVAISFYLLQFVSGQSFKVQHLSAERIKELEIMSLRMQRSVDPEKYACDSFYDYACGRHVPLYSILGSMPQLEDLIKMQGELENESLKFAAKQKMLDFFISCGRVKNVEQCYRQTFVYFKPLYGYLITKNYIENANAHEDFMGVLDRFLAKSEHTKNSFNNPIREKLYELKREFRKPHSYFRVSYLNDYFKSLRIYRDSYEHNVRNLELFRRRNSSYETGAAQTMLDWSLYVYQSRHKPMSYYHATLSPHLWMALYNITARFDTQIYFQQLGECLRLPQFVNMLEEARIMAIVYLKSFRSAWEDYRSWILMSRYNQEVFEAENQILREFYMNNKRIFFTLYAQNFCDFGKELAESVFYLGLKENQDFLNVFSCNHQLNEISQCNVL